MIYVKIGHEERKIEDAQPRWIVSSIEGWRRTHGDVCVQVRFKIPGVNLILTTPSCTSCGGVPGRFNADERRLIEHWRELGLFDNPLFPPSTVVTFVERVARKFGIAA